MEPPACVFARRFVSNANRFEVRVEMTDDEVENAAAEKRDEDELAEIMDAMSNTPLISPVN